MTIIPQPDGSGTEKTAKSDRNRRPRSRRKLQGDRSGPVPGAAAATSTVARNSNAAPPTAAKSKLDAALEAARRGFRVFPLVPNKKTPAFEGWQIAATQDESRITEWWKKNPDYNIGILMEGYLALDVDPRNGGQASLVKLIEDHKEDFPRTLCVKTQSGGTHVIFKLPEGVRLSSSKNKFGPGIDIKTGAGNYLVAAGSTIDGKSYEWLKRPDADKPGDPALCPTWIIERNKARLEKSSAAGKRLVEEDDTAIARATKWLEEKAPEAASGNRDNTAFAIAAKLYDFGLYKPTVLGLVHKWNDERCQPPLSIEEIERIVDSAERNRAKPIGVDHPDNASGFEPTKVEEPENRKKPEKENERKFDWITAAESAAKATSQPQNWLIENVMYEGGEVALIGKPGEGKSFLVLALLYHIAKGLAFAGKKVKQGLAIYVAAEAQGGVHKRMGALKVRYGELDGAPFAIIAHAPDLAHGLEDAKLLLEVIREIEAHFGQKAAIIAFDTLNRVMAGGDENGPKDMGAVLNAVRYIRTETGAASLIVHHPGWSGEHGRGHSSQFGAVDTDLFVANGNLTVKKLRDGESGGEIAFRLKPTTVDFTAEGDRITSCYVETGKKGEIQIGLTDTEEEIFEAIEENAGDGRTFTAADIRGWLKSRSGLDWNPKALHEHIRHIQDKSRIRKDKRGQYVICKSGISRDIQN
jgi:hypothetical protein